MINDDDYDDIDDDYDDIDDDIDDYDDDIDYEADERESEWKGMLKWDGKCYQSRLYASGYCINNISL